MNTETTQTNQADLDVDNLLDGTLDDLADLPDIGPWPAGTHSGSIVSWKQETTDDKKVQGAKNVVINLTIKADKTVELPSNSDGPGVSPGAEARISFFIKHVSSPKAQEIGQGKFKEILACLAEHYGKHSPRELMEKSTGAECLFVTSLRTNSKNKDQKFTDLKALSVM